MADDNKPIKYLRYAIGEIFLVVIGILIALQVNEWNNERNKNKAEKIILIQIKNDLKKSQTELEEVKKYYFERTRASALILRTFWKTETPNDSVANYLQLPLSIQIYHPILGTGKSLINSGRIDLLRSSMLKNEIISYVEKIDDKLVHITRHEESYFRKGRESILEIMPNNFRSKEYYVESFKKELPENVKKDFANELNSVPVDLDKVPFQSDLNELLKSEKFFKAYYKLWIAHYNIYKTYDEILVLTNDLLEKLNN